MVDFSIEGIATLKDKVTPTLERIEESLDEVSDELQEGSSSAAQYRSTLEKAIPESTTQEAKVLEQAIDDMIDSGDVSSAEAWRDSIRRTRYELAKQGEIVGVSKERIEDLGREFSETAVDILGFRESLEEAIEPENAAEADALGKAIDRVVDKGDVISVKTLTKSLNELSTHQVISNKTAMSLANQIDEVGDEAIESAGEVQALNASLMATDGGLNNVREASDDTDDAFDKLGFSSARLSADFGILHVSLSDLVKTLPELGIVLGSLTKAFGGMALAVGGAGGAFAGLMAGGMLGWAQALDQQFASVEGTSEGMMIIMKALGRAIADAMQPLVHGQLADGTSVMEAFMDVLGGLVDVVRTLAVGFRDILALPEVQEFFNEIGGSILGANAQAGGLARTLDALRDATAQVLPIITEAFLVVGGKIPDIIDSWSDASAAIGDDIIDLLGALFDLMSALADFGVILGEVIIPHLAVLIEAGAQLGHWLNGVDEDTIQLAGAFFMVAFAVSEAKAAIVALKSMGIAASLTRTVLLLTAIAVALLHVTGALDEAKAAFEGLLSVIPGVSDEMASSIGESDVAFTTFVATVLAGAFKMGGAIKWLSGVFGRLGTSIGRVRALGFTGWLTEFSTTASGLASVLARIAAWGSSLAGSLATVAAGLSTVVGLMLSSGSVAEALGVAFGALVVAVGSVPAAIAAIVAAIVGLIFAIGYLTGDLQKAIDRVEWVQDALWALTNPIEATKKAIGGVLTFVNKAITDFDGLVTKLEETKEGTGLLSYFLTGLAGLIKGASILIKGLGWAVRAAGSVISKAVTKLFIKPFQKFKDWFSQFGFLEDFFVLLFKGAKYAAMLAGALILIVNPLLLTITVLGVLIQKWDAIMAKWNDFKDAITDISGVRATLSFLDETLWALTHPLETLKRLFQVLGEWFRNAVSDEIARVNKEIEKFQKNIEDTKKAIEDSPIGTAMDWGKKGADMAGDAIPDLNSRGRNVGSGRGQRGQVTAKRSPQIGPPSVVNNNNITVNAERGMSKQEARETARDVDREMRRRRRNRRGY